MGGGGSGVGGGLGPGSGSLRTSAVAPRSPRVCIMGTRGSTRVPHSPFTLETSSRDWPVTAGSCVGQEQGGQEAGGVLCGAGEGRAGGKGGGCTCER